MKPTYLYIKQHKITGLKYFGKTTKNDPYSYNGSGKYWKNHIKKHGLEFVETVWVKLFTDKHDLIEFSIFFSEENNIVKSLNWANLKDENGLDGGFDKGGWTVEQIENNRLKAKERWKNGVYDPEKLRISRIGFKQPNSQKEKVSRALSKEWKLTKPNGEMIIIKNLRKFCIENNLDQGNMTNVSKGKLKHYKGWRCEKIT